MSEAYAVANAEPVVPTTSSPNDVVQMVQVVAPSTLSAGKRTMKLRCGSRYMCVCVCVCVCVFSCYSGLSFDVVSV